MTETESTTSEATAPRGVFIGVMGGFSTLFEKLGMKTENLPDSAETTRYREYGTEVRAYTRKSIKILSIQYRDENPVCKRDTLVFLNENGIPFHSDREGKIHVFEDGESAVTLDDTNYLTIYLDEDRRPQAQVVDERSFRHHYSITEEPEEDSSDSEEMTDNDVSGMVVED